MSAKRYLLLVESSAHGISNMQVVPLDGRPLSLKEVQRLSAIELATPVVSRCRIVEVVAEVNKASPE